jgi:hypothetical protein
VTIRSASGYQRIRNHDNRHKEALFMNARSRITLCSLALAVAAACSSSSRPSSDPRSATLDVYVSAGTPIQGATIAVTAVDDSGQPVTGVGTAGPTDAAGHVSVVLTPGFAGLAQVVASVGGLQYADPTSATSGVSVSIPSGVELSSYVVDVTPGELRAAPVTLLTTLADHEALAFALGRHPGHPARTRLAAAVGMRDPLFAAHVQSSSAAWAPSTFRTSVPAPLTSTATTLGPSGYAALFDVGLSGLAHALGVQAGYDAASTTINAMTLLQLFEQDLDADAVFDGLGANNALLQTDGTSPVALSAETLRLPLAYALDRWAGTTDNASGISRADLNGAGVYSSMGSDASDLFGAAPSGAFIFDTTPPAVTFVDTFVSYYDERGMTAAADSSGLAFVPPQYSYVAGTKRALPNGSQIYKAATRLGWTTTAPTVVQLEGMDPYNLPALKWSVAYNPTTDTPIASATYSVDVSCTGCSTTTPATGDLWPAGSMSGVLFYDLPLSSNLIPQLATLPAPGTLSVTVTVTDAAGNTTTTSPLVYVFHVIGAPLAVAEDTNYPAAWDPLSSYPYNLQTPAAFGDGFELLYDTTTTVFGADNAVRLDRYIVTNPSTSPVALTVPSFAGGTWSSNETWTLQGIGTYIGYQALLASTSAAGPSWTCPLSQTCANCGPSYCLWQSACASSTYIWYPSAGSFAGQQCNVQLATVTGTQASSGLVALGYEGSNPAQKSTGGRFIVPPAVGTTPGMLSVYVARPRAGVTRSIPLTNPGGASAHWRQDLGQQAVLTGHDGCTIGRCIANAWRSLTAAADVFSGQWAPETFGVTTANQEVGEATTGPTYSFSYSMGK